MCVCVCARARARVCVRVCVCACTYKMCRYIYVCLYYIYKQCYLYLHVAQQFKLGHKSLNGALRPQRGKSGPFRKSLVGVLRRRHVAHHHSRVLQHQLGSRARGIVGHTHLGDFCGPFFFCVGARVLKSQCASIQSY